MIDCEKFKKESDEMRLKLIKVNHELIEFNHDQFFNIKNIYCHIYEWNYQIQKIEKNTKTIKWNEATSTRVKILTIVIDYFNETNGFEPHEII